MILFLFLSHLGVGIVWTLLLVSRQAGVKFFRFNAGLAAILLAIGLALRPSGMTPGADAQGISLVALGAATAAIVAYWATIGRLWTAARPFQLAAAAAGGALAVVAQAVAAATETSAPMAVLTVLSFLTSAALLGGSCTAMILGHWYLVIPSMDVAFLQSIVKFHIGSAILRTLVVGIVTWLAVAGAAPGLTVDFGRYVLSVSGVFFWQRVLFGLAGPLVLSYLTWETAKIRSTQSATGILYVDFFAVIVGELLAKYLLLETGAPV